MQRPVMSTSRPPVESLEPSDPFRDAIIARIKGNFEALRKIEDAVVAIDHKTGSVMGRNVVAAAERWGNPKYNDLYATAARREVEAYAGSGVMDIYGAPPNLEAYLGLVAQAEPTTPVAPAAPIDYDAMSSVDTEDPVASARRRVAMLTGEGVSEDDNSRHVNEPVQSMSPAAVSRTAPAPAPQHGLYYEDLPVSKVYSRQ